MDNDEIMKGMGENTIKTIWRHCPVIKYQPSNKEVSLVVTRMMHDGARWQAPWHISICIPTFIYATHRYSLTSFFFFFFFACPSSRLCARLPFSPFVSESEETSLSVSAFSLLCAHTHTHVHTHAHKYRTCTDTQTPAPTETRTHTHTHSLPSAAVMAPSCQNILAFSPSLSQRQPDWACRCRFSETAVYPPSLHSLFLSFSPPFRLSIANICSPRNFAYSISFSRGFTFGDLKECPHMGASC